MPTMSLTTPSGRPAVSRRGPCSMCSSRYAASSFGSRRASAGSPVGDAALEATERRRGPKEANAETRTFLVGPGDDLDRASELDLRVDERFDGFDRTQHSERSVEAATLWHRVEMRPDEERRAFALETG